jgi:hypothetical protein
MECLELLVLMTTMCFTAQGKEIIYPVGASVVDASQSPFNAHGDGMSVLGQAVQMRIAMNLNRPL